MTRYVIRRVIWALGVFWVVTTLTFVATFLSPIDPASSYAGLRASEETLQAITEQFGLNEPVWVQYSRYMQRVVSLKLGDSYASGKPVMESLVDALPATAVLAAAASVIQVVLGVPLGFAAALRRGNRVDRTVMSFSIIGVILPSFVLGQLLLYTFAVRWGLFPIGGQSAKGLVLPSLTLGVVGAAWIARFVRSAVVEVLGEDFVRMARSKGLPRRLVVGRHVLRNALAPIVTIVAADLGALLGGVLVIEKVYGWPGLGSLAWRAFQFNDIPLIMGTVLLGSVLITVLNLAADVVNATVDPRIRSA